MPCRHQDFVQAPHNLNSTRWVGSPHHIILPLRGPTCKLRTCKNLRQVEFQVRPECGNKMNKLESNSQFQILTQRLLMRDQADKRTKQYHYLPLFLIEDSLSSVRMKIINSSNKIQGAFIPRGIDSRMCQLQHLLIQLISIQVMCCPGSILSLLCLTGLCPSIALILVVKLQLVLLCYLNLVCFGLMGAI